MKPIKCPNCGNSMVVEESNQYLSCDGCGKRYFNPYYVEKKSTDTADIENTSSDSDKNEHANTVLRCVSCNEPLRRNDSLPILTCDLCRKEHKNPYYKPSQPANAQENTTNSGASIAHKTNNTNNVGEKKTKASAMSKVVFAIKKVLSRHFPTRITIPQGVTNIGDKAFYRCSGLTSVVIPDGVTSIGSESFFCCRKLKNIVIPDSVTSIGFQAFSCCRKLKNIVIPDSVTSIDCRAFEVCCSLTSITIPGSVKSIGDNAFDGCTSLTSITIPDSVTSIGEGAFASCNSLTSITVASGNPVYHSAGNCLIETATGTLIAGCKNSVIPADGSVTNIGNYAFSHCSGLKKIAIPDSVTTIGKCAFFCCISLTSATIPDSVTRIGSSVFSCCDNLTFIIIPNSVTCIGDSAFCICRHLTHITIPDSVTKIGESAFRGCDRLTRITFKDTTDWCRTTSYSNWGDRTGGTSTTVTNPSTNAINFTSTYSRYYWYKE